MREKITLDISDPTLCLEWHPFKNEKSPSDFTRSSKEKIWWKCLLNENHTDFHSTIDNRIYRKTICPQCSLDKKSIDQRMSLDDFIKRAIDIHNHKYIYDKVIYINSRTKIIITCAVCNNEFLQNPHSHLSGRGCSKCANIAHAKRLFDIHLKDGVYYSYNSYNQKTFINNAILIHGEKYDYSKCIYMSSNKKVILICKKCLLEFKQSPNDHIHAKAGCPACAKTKLSLLFRDSVEDIIEKANAIHNNKYDYAELKYINNNTIGKIFCKKCNSFFKQKIASHLQGSGCPNCKSFANERLTGDLLKDILKINIDKQFYVKRNNAFLRIDYRFILNNKEYFVEYNGRQHYEPVCFGQYSNEQANQNLINQKERDDWLKKYCEINNIELISIDGRKYKGKNIKQFLINIVK